MMTIPHDGIGHPSSLRLFSLKQSIFFWTKFLAISSNSAEKRTADLSCNFHYQLPEQSKRATSSRTKRTGSVAANRHIQQRAALRPIRRETPAYRREH
jgi:hypothetical protein